MTHLSTYIKNNPHYHGPNIKIKLGREVKDYLSITFGLICYALGWAAFLLPYQITTGGVTGISAIIYYVTGIEIQVSYFIINAVFLGFALKILGPKFSLKTIYAIFMLTFLLWLFQALLKNPNGTLPQLLGPGQEFMACVVGAGLLGFGIGIVFCNNGRPAERISLPGLSINIKM